MTDNLRNYCQFKWIDERRIDFQQICYNYCPLRERRSIYFRKNPGDTWINVCWVCAAGLSEPLPDIIVYFVANYRPHLSHFWANVIFTIPTLSLSIYVSTLSILLIGHPNMN